jgi:hypothetical protein
MENLVASVNPHDLSDIPWREALRAEAVQPHRLRVMIPLQDRSPIYSFVCPICSQTAYSCDTAPPDCRGGYDGR